MKKLNIYIILSFCFFLFSMNISCETNGAEDIIDNTDTGKDKDKDKDKDDEDKDKDDDKDDGDDDGNIDPPPVAGDTELKVFQLNLWHSTSTVPSGYDGAVDIIKQLEPDIVMLCEINNSNNEFFVPKLLKSLRQKGLEYYGESLDMSVGILSKYKLKDFDRFKSPGSMLKASVDINGQTVVIYSAHLDYTHYECYLPRGYSGTTWKKLDAPVTDVDYILVANREATRDEAIANFIVDAKKETDKGNIVIMGGDFNEPSHLDWQENTKDLWDHNGVVINWDCSVMLTEAGYKDSYREIYPDPVKYPAFTFPSANKYVDVSKLAWAPDVDERDRIDFIYFYPNPVISLEDAKIVGPSGSVYFGKQDVHDAEDEFIEPNGVWPTDHKGNMATFVIKASEKQE
ncbi:MAG: endonuclease/exonuclease/phosphatase family protein [Prevotella sp.]|jgi:exonuclease III|nr:endonuclease/exonuclease/phosphatase family protein [Prevotella sp.]